MASSDHNAKELLEAYLDHQLDENERRQFDDAAQRDPEILKEIERQEKIDASLTKMFTPPSKPRFVLPSLESLQAEADVPDAASETTSVEPAGRSEQLLEAYLDHQLDENERRQFDDAAQRDPEILKEIERQEKIDASLTKMFTPPSKPRFVLPSLESLQAEADAPDAAAETALVEPARRSDSDSQKRSNGVSRRLVLAALATAAAVAWLIVGAELFAPSGREQIAFQQRPLTEVYHECVSQGFSPYWVCDDETTFANTFEKRQGVKLKLDEMPSNRRMVGLSYLAGLSRKSTSMLAEVDEQPVIVFIDRIENDWHPATGTFSDDGLTVTRTEKGGLVLYEVSPVPDDSVVDSILVF